MLKIIKIEPYRNTLLDPFSYAITVADTTRPAILHPPVYLSAAEMASLPKARTAFLSHLGRLPVLPVDQRTWEELVAHYLDQPANRRAAAELRRGIKRPA